MFVSFNWLLEKVGMEGFEPSGSPALRICLQPPLPVPFSHFTTQKLSPASSGSYTLVR